MYESALDSNRLLASLDEDIRHGLAKLCHVRDFGPQTEVSGQDEEPEAVYLVLAGQIRLRTFSEGGQEIFFDVIGPGGVFGEKEALDGGANSCSAITLTSVKLAVLPKSDFLRAFENHPEFAKTVARFLCQKLREREDRIMGLGTIAAHNRVHAELLRLAREAGPDSNGEYLISPAPSHSDISRQVCTARETVSRAFSQMNKLAITKKVKGGLIITDLVRLEDMVDSAKSGDRRSGHDRRHGGMPPSGIERRTTDRRNY